MKGGDKMRNKKGFTLIELLVVIAIIAILSAIGLVALNGAREKARDAQRRSDIAQIRTALSLYYDDHGSTYPVMHTAAGVVTGDLSADSVGADATANGTLTAGGPLTSNYLAQALKSPTAGSADDTLDHYYYLTSLAAAGGAPIASPTNYIVYTKLEAAGKTDFYGINEQGTVTDLQDGKTALPTCDAYTPLSPVCAFR